MLTHKFKLASSSALIAIVLSLGARHAFATNYTWTGGGADGNWGTSADWAAPNNQPGVGTTVDIFFAGTTRLSSTNNYTAFDQFQNISFSSGAGSFTISGNAVNLFGKIENSSTNLQTVTLNQIDFENGANGNELDPTAGDLTISSNIFLDNNTVLHVFGSGGHVLTLNNAIANGGGSTGSFVDETNNIVVFNAANTYSGNTTVKGGELRFGAGGSANNSTILIGDTTGSQNATVTLSSTGAQTLSSAMTVQASNSGTETLKASNTSGSSQWNGTITLGKALTVAETSASGTFQLATLTASSLQTLTVGDAATTNAGTVIFAGSTDNTNVAATVASGTLVLGKTSSSTVHAVGNGGGAAALTINSGAVAQLGGSGTAQLFNQSGVVDNGLFDFKGNSVGFDALTGSGTLTNSTSSTSGTLTIGAGNSVASNGTFNGVLTDSGTLALVKTGTGVFTLTGSDSYRGGTNISNGVLNIRNANALGAASGAVTVSSGATLQLQGGITTGTNALSLNGAGFTNGALDSVSGTNTYTGSVTLAGTSTISSDANSLTLTGGIVNGGNRVVITGAGDTIISTNAITGTGGDILKQGTGNLYLNVASGYTGSTSGSNNAFVDQGTINAGVTGALGTTNGTTTGAVNLGSSVTAGLNSALNISGTGVTVANPINVRYLQTGGKSITSTATSGTNTYSGAINLADHVSLSAGTGSTLLFTGVISQVSGTLSGTPGAGNIVNTSPTGGFSTTGPGVIINGGTGSGNSGVVEYDAAMTYLGDTVVNTGTLQFNGAGSLANSSIRLGNSGAATLNLISPTGSTLNVTVNVRPSVGVKVISASNTSGTSTLGGHFALDDDAQVIEASPTGTLAITQLRTTGTDTISATDIKGHTLTLTPAGTINFAGTIYSSTGTGNIVMNGTGLAILSASNSYTGTTTVSSGQLTVQNNSGLGTSGVTVSAGAKLLEDTGVSFTNTVTLAGTNAQFSRNVGAGLSYAGMTASSNFGNSTKFTILGGTNGSGSGETLLTSLTNSPTHDSIYRASDVLNLSGNAGQKFVLQLSYNPADLAPGATPYLGWYDATLGLYVNAAYGNSVQGSVDGTGELTGSWVSNGSTMTLGAFGYDGTTDTVWAVIDHNSEFAVIPEPSTYAMVLTGFAIFAGFKRVRRRSFRRE